MNQALKFTLCAITLSIRHHEWISSESDFAKSISEDKFRDDQAQLKVPSGKSSEIEHKKQIKKKNTKSKDVQSQQNLPSAQGNFFSVQICFYFILSEFDFEDFE